MKIRNRVVLWSVCLALTGAWLLPAATPVRAQSPAGQDEDAGQQSATPDQPPAEELSKQDRKQAAKERRIQAYLRKKEERRAEREQNRTAREQTQRESAAEKIEQQQLDDVERAESAQRATTPVLPPQETLASTESVTKKNRRRGQDQGASRLPRGLARAQANIRTTELGLDPTVQEYLGLIDEEGASPQQLAAFGSFVAQNGMVRDALEYYDVALKIDDRDPVLWVNMGTLQMQTRNHSAAASAFGHALTLDPNHAVAHYNLGAALDEMNKYEAAVAEYKAALTLDPSLGDPTYNPQSANNELLLAVKLMLYQEQAGSLSVPLLDLTTGKLPTSGNGESEPQ